MKGLKRSLAVLCCLLLGACSSAPPKPPAAPPPKAPPKPARVDPSAVAEAERWRATPPRPGPSPAPVIPAIRQAKLKNGLTVLVSERHDLPLVDLRVALRAGAAAETPDKSGLADLTYKVMMEGAGKLDGVALAEAFADLGTRAHVSTKHDGATFQVTVLSRHLDRAVGLLAQVIRKPRLAKADFQRRKKRQRAGLVRSLGSPRYLMWRALREAVFGASHPYGTSSRGTIQTLGGLRHADARKFHKQHVTPAEAAVIFSGDVTLDQARAMVKKHLGRWRSRAKPRRPLSHRERLRAPLESIARIPPPTSKRVKVIVVPKPGLGQTYIALGRPALAVGHADEWRLAMATVAFGGMFTSRLNMNLREDKGYTYGARASARRGRIAGWLVLTTPVQADKTGAALKEILAEMDRLKARPLTAAEFTLARDGSLRSVSGWFEAVSSMGGAMATIFQRGLPLDRLQRKVKAYQEMKRQQAQATGEAYFKKGLMEIVLVGDPDLIKKQVAPMKLGKIEVVPIK